MDFDLTPEQQELRDALAGFAAAELNDDVAQRDRDGAFARESWIKCAEYGIQGLPVPRDLGGAGADVTTIVAALEGTGLRLPRQRPHLLTERADVVMPRCHRQLRQPRTAGAIPPEALRRHADRGSLHERARIRL